MKLLLDTHALLWWWTDDARLSEGARALLADPQHLVLVSAASAWEIATKHRIGKLPGAEAVIAHFEEWAVADGFNLLAIQAAHCLRAGSFEVEHRDPFDRMLAAQSEIEDAALVSRDAAFGDFGTRMVW